MANPGRATLPQTKANASVLSICEYLEHAPLWQSRNLHILTYVCWGSEILYRTRHSVVGTGTHRDTQAILDTYAILAAKRDEDAFRLVRERRIDTILLCRDFIESRFYVKASTSTFYRRLCEGHLPSWCRQVPLPDDLAESFKLFEVAPL